MLYHSYEYKRGAMLSNSKLLETQALISNAMQAIDDGQENFAQTCLNKAYTLLENLMGDEA